MTQRLILLCSLVMALRCDAQVVGPNTYGPDMYFWMDFSPLPGSPDNASLSGSAGYYQVKSFPIPGAPRFTNWLEFGISMSSPPLESWILEKQPDGSFNPVVQVTNLIEDAGTFYLRPAPLTLTTNQVHSLIAGNWYAAVDFGPSNYLGQLVPAYDFANGPTAKVVLPPDYDMVITPSVYKAISPNNRDAGVVFDASPSMDPFYLPMQFAWTGWDGLVFDAPLVFTNSGVLVTNVFKTGEYLIRLEVSDSIATSYPYYFILEVTTAGQEINSMLAGLQQMSLPAPQRRALVDSLSKAAIRFNRGYITQGCAELRVFKNLLRAFKLTPIALSYFSNKTQFILDAFNKPSR